MQIKKEDAKAVPRELKKVALSQIEQLGERALAILESQIGRLETAAKTSTFTYSQFNLLTETIRTLASLQRAMKPTIAASQEKEKVTNIEKELSTMTRDEILELVFPHLEAMGIDINSLPLESKKQEKELADGESPSDSEVS